VVLLEAVGNTILLWVEEKLLEKNAPVLVFCAIINATRTGKRGSLCTLLSYIQHRQGHLRQPTYVFFGDIELAFPIGRRWQGLGSLG
jgi:hypothetical protein